MIDTAGQVQTGQYRSVSTSNKTCYGIYEGARCSLLHSFGEIRPDRINLGQECPRLDGVFHCE
jgi:hypothetical protein